MGRKDGSRCHLVRRYRPRPRQHCVRWGPSLPQQGGGWDPQFLAYVCCGQTAEWNKMTLGMEVGLGPGHIVLDMGTQVPSPKRDTARSPIFCPSLLWPFWPNGWMHQDATWYGDRHQPRRLCVRWRPCRLPKKGWSPQFSAHVYCGQTAGWIKMTLGMEVGLGPGHSARARWGPGSPLPKRRQGSQFSAHFYCDQTAGCIKMPLGVEVDFIPGDFVLDGTQLPLPQKALCSIPQFR